MKNDFNDLITKLDPAKERIKKPQIYPETFPNWK